MKRYFSKQHADYSKREMEAETISKNAARPKSLTSRKNRKTSVLLLLLAVLLVFNTCSKHDETEDEPDPDSVVIDAIDVTGRIELEENSNDIGNLFLETLYEQVSLESANFSTTALSCDYPQLMLVQNFEEDIILMSRDFYSAEKPVKVDAQSTTIALVTLHPLLAPITKEDYSELVGLVTATKSYPELYDEVRKSIENRQNIFDMTNTSLMAALNNLFGELCPDESSEVSDVEELLRSAVTTRSGLDINAYPLSVTAGANDVTIRNTDLTPSYYGTVLNKSTGQLTDLAIPANDDYPGLDLLQRHYGDQFQLGTPIKYAFINEGNYQFSLSRITGNGQRDFIGRLIQNILGGLGIPLVSELNEGALMYVLSKGNDLLTMDYENPYDFIRFTAGLLSEYFDNEEVMAGLSKHKWSGGLRKLAKFANGALQWYSIGVTSGNTALRVTSWIHAPEEIDFCIYYYQNKVSSCTESRLIIAGGNEQSGYSNQRLLTPIKVFVETKADDGTYLQDSYQKVKFEVVKGDGVVLNEIVGTDEHCTASTYWVLGEGDTWDEQRVKAVVVDLVTEEEISEPVYFTATIKERSDLTIRLDWVKVAGYTDIDLHVIDPFGEEIYFAHKISASGGWLDRDDIIGPGPEHVYWKEAPAGEYIIKVHHYGSESQSVIGFTVTVYANDQIYQKRGSVAYHQEVSVGRVVIPEYPETRSTLQPFIFKEENGISYDKMYEKK
ncbi:MAG: hypothetical protein LBC40_05435 [Dysgonamonadaceae bacterium]|jgi:hypothetical protein|nr:hypothetical protein [Dysgonamonadaceae bacterium]